MLKLQGENIFLSVLEKEHYYGSEAIKLILEHGYNNIGLNRIWANTLECNISAQKALEKCGFKKEGHSRQDTYFAGKYFDKLHYSLLRNEYNKK